MTSGWTSDGYDINKRFKVSQVITSNPSATTLINVWSYFTMKTTFVAVCVVAVTLALVLQETDGFYLSLKGRGYKRSKVKLNLNITKKQNKTKKNRKKTEKKKHPRNRKILLGRKRAKPQKSVGLDLIRKSLTIYYAFCALLRYKNWTDEVCVQQHAKWTATKNGQMNPRGTGSKAWRHCFMPLPKDEKEEMDA